MHALCLVDSDTLRLDSLQQPPLRPVEEPEKVVQFDLTLF